MMLRRFNDDGISKFAAWLDALRENGAEPVPTHLLKDDSLTELIADSASLVEQVFESRADAASTLSKIFSEAGLTSVVRDSGLWAWLSLFYIDSTCPAKGGIRKPGAEARHIPRPGEFKRYYRHLLAGPYRIFRAHRDDPARADCLLIQPVDKPGDLVEQIAARQELVTSPSIVSLATKLYVKNSRVKAGAGGKGPGSVRRLVTALDQFELTWDIAGARVEEFTSILPKEFGRFAAA